MPQIAGKQLKDSTVTATQVDTTNGTISTVNAGDSASEGSGSGLSRRDHQHAVSTGTASTVDADSTNTEGSASSLARSDHTHSLSTGAATTLDSADTNTEGSSANLARADHTHEIDETGTVSTIQPDDAAADGSATGFARKDHTHAIVAAAAVGVSDTNAEGSSTSFSRADHTHKLQEVQESITTEAITGTDTALADTLTTAPRTGSVVKLFLNGVQQEEGATKDFTVSSQTITWLASTGTAVDLETSDVLVAVYST